MRVRIVLISIEHDDRIEESEIIGITMAGFRKCASIAAHYNLHDVFDNLVISLCKFTSLHLGSQDSSSESIAYQLGASEKAILATITVFTLAHRHGDILRDGWKNLLDVMHRLHYANLYPPELEEVDDFVTNEGRKNITFKSKQSKQETGFWSTLASYMAPSDHYKLTAEEEEAILKAKSCVQECHIELLLQDTKFFRTDSLQELVKIIIGMIASSDSDADYAVFMLELLMRVVFHNRDRVPKVWHLIQPVLCASIVKAENYSFFVERCTVNLIQFSIKLIRREEIAAQITACLKVLLLIRPRVRNEVLAKQIIFGLHDLIESNSSNTPQSNIDWSIVYKMLQVLGCGMYASAAILDDAVLGFKSDIIDSDHYGHQPPDLPDILPDDSQRQQPFNNALPFDRTFPFHSREAFEKAKVCIRLLNASLNWSNVSAAIECNRWFIECSLSFSAKLVERRVARHRGGYEVEDEEHLLKTYQDVSNVMVDCLNVIHCRVIELAPKPLTAELVNDAWVRCWVPVLQATARSCCDPRPGVRGPALTYLQRAFLFPDLHNLSPAHWEAAFSLVLFPLLQFLLEFPMERSSVMEETRMRACTQIMCKVFLQHFHSLTRLPTFTALWLTILDFIDKYLKLNFDLLSEAISESLKNVLLVMQTSNVLKPDNQLWKLTWDRINVFLPTLQQELAERQQKSGGAGIVDQYMVTGPGLMSLMQMNVNEQPQQVVIEQQQQNQQVEVPVEAVSSDDVVVQLPHQQQAVATAPLTQQPVADHQIAPPQPPLLFTSEPPANLMTPVAMRYDAGVATNGGGGREDV